MCKASVSVTLAIFLLVILAMPTYSAVIYVKTDGNDANDGSSWELAKRTVKAGLTSASGTTNDEVWVAAGTYLEHTLGLQVGAKLYGGFAGNETSLADRPAFPRPSPDLNETVIDGSNKSFVIGTGNANTDTRIDGFTIRNGKSIYGGGIYCINSSPTISNNTITGNSADYGGGIYCRNSSPTILNNIITDNGVIDRISVGGGIYCENSSPTISNNTITRNGNTGIFCFYSSPAISNNIITANKGAGVICSYFSKAIISNNTVTSNSYGIYFDGSSATVSNNIIAFNLLGMAKDKYDSVKPILRNNCVYNPTGANYEAVSPGVGDISVDPKLADFQYGNLHIQPDSPCIDAGDDSVVQSGWVDMDSQARIQGDHVDIGADESDGTQWPMEPYVIVRVTPNGNDANDGSSWELAKQTVQAGIDAASKAGGEVWVAAGTYNERISLRPYAYLYGGFAGMETVRDERDWVLNTTILDGSAGGRVVTAEYCHMLSSIDGFTIRNGKSSAAGGIYCTYSSPTISNNIITGNISTGIGTSITGVIIYGGGIYCFFSSPMISNNSITANNGSGICCDNSSSPTITNNTIATNSGTSGSGIFCFLDSSPLISNNLITGNIGRGVFCYSSPVITNNTIVNNSGGGIFCSFSSATITNNIIADNSADYGGGIYCDNYYSRPIISSNTVTGNSASYYGGGIYCDHSSLATVTNNTIADNSARQGGGIYCDSSSTTVSNNILAFNSSGIYYSSGSVFRNNCIYPGQPLGEGDISADPLFRDSANGDYHLRWNSPCINAGWNDAPGLSQFDMDGQGRIFKGIVDIGADEYWLIKVQPKIIPVKHLSISGRAE